MVCWYICEEVDRAGGEGESKYRMIVLEGVRERESDIRGDKKIESCRVQESGLQRRVRRETRENER